MFIILLIVILIAIVGLFAKFYSPASGGRFESEINSEKIVENSQTINQWWAKKRIRYNTGLIISGFTAFLAYAILGELLIVPYDKDFEITLFTMFFQGMAYLLLMLVANLLYNLGPLIDKRHNKDNSEAFRKRLYKLGFWFSLGLPLLIPVSLVIEYFVRSLEFKCGYVHLSTNFFLNTF